MKRCIVFGVVIFVLILLPFICQAQGTKLKVIPLFKGVFDPYENEEESFLYLSLLHVISFSKLLLLNLTSSVSSSHDTRICYFSTEVIPYRFFDS